MNINDTAFPAPTLVNASTIPGGSVVRIGDNYVVLSADGGTWWDLTAGNTRTVVGTDQVQLVTATLVISAPSA